MTEHSDDDEMPPWLQESLDRDYKDWAERQMGRKPDGSWCLKTYRESLRRMCSDRPKKTDST